MKVREIIKLLENNGWTLVNTEGSHRQYKHHFKASRFKIKKMDKYLIVLEKSSTGFSAYTSDVLGCIATGDTIDNTLLNMRSALRLHLKAMIDDGESIPQSRGIESYLEVVSESEGEEYLMTHIPISEILAMQYSSH